MENIEKYFHHIDNLTKKLKINVKYSKLDGKTNKKLREKIID